MSIRRFLFQNLSRHGTDKRSVMRCRMYTEPYSLECGAGARRQECNIGKRN